MSSIIFYTDAEQALVVTDTLAANPDGTPFLFTSKAHYLPHLRTIVAGTGIGQFSVDWFVQANSRMLVAGIENLNEHAPSSLRALWSRYRAEYSLPEDMTTTVYHFGISERSNSLVAYAYRSTADFESEILRPGVGVKPECSVPEGNLFEHIPSMLEDQRSAQSAIPLAERVFIGGEAFAIHLTRETCTFSRIHRFSDYEAQLRQALHAHGASAA